MTTIGTGRPWTRWVQPALGALVLGVLVLELGAAPFVEALRSLSPEAVALAVGITFVTTLCCAWRWTVVARSLGLELGFGTAVAASYRSFLLNSTLPGGVLGDVERAVRHGRDVGQLGRSARAVVWERTLGQVVQVLLTAALLLVLPSPVPGWTVTTVVVAALLMAVVAGALLAARRQLGRSRVGAAVTDDLRRALGAPTRYVVLLTSVLVVVGHVAVFLVAFRAAGVEAPLTTRLWLALVVLLAAAVPVSLAGWGPREGAATWVFGAAGLGAATGLTVAVLYGVLALVDVLPGAVDLVGGRSGARRPAGGRGDEGDLAHPAAAQPTAPQPVGADEVRQGLASDVRGDGRLVRGEGPQE